MALEEINAVSGKVPCCAGKSKNAVALNILITVDKDEELEDQDKCSKSCRRTSKSERPAICYDKPKPKKNCLARTNQCPLVPAPSLPPNSVILPCGCLGFYDECRKKFATENVFGLCRKDNNGCGGNQCWDKPGRGRNSLCSTTAGCQTINETVTKNCQYQEIRPSRKSADTKSPRTSAGSQTPGTCIPKTKEQIIGTEPNETGESQTDPDAPSNRNSASESAPRRQSDPNKMVSPMTEDGYVPPRYSLPQSRKASASEDKGPEKIDDTTQSRKASAVEDKGRGSFVDQPQQPRKSSGAKGTPGAEDVPQSEMRRSFGDRGPDNIEDKPQSRRASASEDKGPESFVDPAQPRRSSGNKGATRAEDIPQSEMRRSFGDRGPDYVEDLPRSWRASASADKGPESFENQQQPRRSSGAKGTPGAEDIPQSEVRRSFGDRGPDNIENKPQSRRVSADKGPECFGDQAQPTRSSGDKGATRAEDIPQSEMRRSVGYREPDNIEDKPQSRRASASADKGPESFGDQTQPRRSSGGKEATRAEDVPQSEMRRSLENRGPDNIENQPQSRKASALEDKGPESYGDQPMRSSGNKQTLEAEDLPPSHMRRSYYDGGPVKVEDLTQMKKTSDRGPDNIDDTPQSRKASSSRDRGPNNLDNQPQSWRASQDRGPESYGDQPRRSSGGKGTPGAEDIPTQQTRKSSGDKGGGLEKFGDPNPNPSAGDCNMGVVGDTSSQCFDVMNDPCCQEQAEAQPPSFIPEETRKRSSQARSDQQPPAFPVDFFNDDPPNAQGRASTSSKKRSNNEDRPRVTTLRDGTTVEELPSDVEDCGNANQDQGCNECDDDYMIGIRSLANYMSCGWNIFWRDVYPVIKRKLQQTTCDGETYPDCNETEAPRDACNGGQQPQGDNSCLETCNHASDCRNERCTVVLRDDAQSQETFVLLVALPIVILGLMVSVRNCCD